MFTTSMPTRKKTPNKLIAGFAALSITAIMTASGLAAAAPNNKPTKQECEKAGFPNYGQCVKEWAHHKNQPGPGYGGSNSTVNVSTNIDLTLDHSNNNVVQVIVNVFR